MANVKKTAAKKAPAKKGSGAKGKGRPPRAGADGPAMHTVLVRLTDHEHAQVARGAKKAELTLAAYVRAAALSISKKP